MRHNSFSHVSAHVLPPTFKKARSSYLLALAAIVLAGCTLVPASAQESASVEPESPAPAFTTLFEYPNFSSVAGLTLNGDSAQVGSLLQVGPPTLYSIGSAWYTNAVSVSTGFTTTFQMQIVPDSSSYTTADGMGFVIQGDGPDTLGASTGQPGYNGIKNSFAVEFDTFQNFPLADPNNNHVALQSCGAGINSMNHGGSCCIGIQPSLPLTMADGNPHEVVISYTPGLTGSGAFSVSIDKHLIITRTVNLSTLLNLNGGFGWVGFTAGSGAAYESADINNWIFSN
jgi:hypothetical protein